MERSVIIVNVFKPLTIYTKRSILDLAAALDPPLRAYNTIDNTAVLPLLLQYLDAIATKVYSLRLEQMKFCLVFLNEFGHTVLGAKLLYRRLKPSGYATENFYFLIFLFLISVHTSDNPKTILGTSKICVAERGWSHPTISIPFRPMHFRKLY